MKNYTDITVLVDRSGSMTNIAEAMEETFRSFLREHRKVESSRISLYQFDTVNPQQVDYVNVPVNLAENLVIHPRGGTPLLDAFCQTIDSTGDRLRNMNEKDRPKRVLFVVITDGAENSSRRFTNSQLKAKITTQREQFKWEFVYLGANQDAFKVAEMYGLNLGSTMTFSSSPMFVGEDSAFGGYLKSTANYAAGQAPDTATITSSVRNAALDDEDRKKYGTTNSGGSTGSKDLTTS
jgi:uncharacterized protein YegL